MKEFTFFSTFTGIGGFEVGIGNAAATTNSRSDLRHGLTLLQRIFTNPKKRKIRATCVGYSEIDKYATQVFEKHYEGVKNYGDITKINAEQLPDFDCLVGGFPCQAFSIAGQRRGFEDTRGTLFFDLARILQTKRPRLFVFENVKGLLSHDNGNTFRTIIATITELGYDCQWQVLNSKDFGVPQNRERIIIVGHLRGTARPQVFPIIGSDQQDISGQQSPSVPVGTLRTHKDGNGFREMKSGLAPTIPARAREDGSGQAVIIQPVQNPDRANKKQNGRRIKDAGDPSHTLTATDKHGILISKTVRAGGRNSPHGSKQNWDSYEVGGVIRRLTPMECERLQAFPDNWTAEGINGPMSDTQRYKMCGNAVTTNVIQAVFERILA